MTSPAAERVTLDQVAARAGVSPAAASLALRGRPGVADATRQRVVEAAEQLGYRARASKEGPPVVTIGLLLMTRSELDVDHGPVIAAINDLCSVAGVDVRLGTFRVDDDGLPLEAGGVVDNAGIDGFLVLGPWLAQEAADRFGDRPVVLVDGDVEDRDRHSNVVSDDAGGAADATASLVARGHRRIVLAGSTVDEPGAIGERRRGYEEAMMEAGLEARFVDGTADDPAATASAVTAELTRRRRFTAVVGATDAVALGVLAEMDKRGIAVPTDMSVIGFDDIEAGRLVRPRLTTVDAHKPAMGRLAASMLFHRLDHPADPPFTVVQRTRLVERDSVAAPRQTERESGKAAVPSRTPG